jgi:monovalent cation:H+ antiporter-2, CPA2 family
LNEVLPLTTIGIIMVIAIGISIIVKKLGQNPVLGFILAGFILGPFGLGFLSPADEVVHAFSELGLFVLLFYLGLELSLKDFLKAGTTSFGMALIDMTGLALIGFIVMQLLGYSLLLSIVVGFMLFCTSTAIVAKFVLDKNLMKNSAAQLSLSVLILQDFLGILLLVLLTSFSGKGNPVSLGLTAMVFAVSAFVVVYQLSKFMEKWLTENGFSHTDITLYALGVGLIVATIASYLDLSITLGAYFAGFALAETRAGNSIKKDVGFMRDFFLLFFFVAFGTTIFYNPAVAIQVLPEITTILYLLGIAVILCIGIILVNIISFGFFGPFFGLKTEDSSLAGLLLTPLGEFVVIIATTSAVVLTVSEQLVVGPLAFLIILVTVIVFTPLYNFSPLHQKIVGMIPTIFKAKPVKKIQETSLKEKNFLQEIALNAFIVLCLAWMTWILYYDLPSFGIPLLYSRQATAIITFLIFAAIPLNNAFKNIKKLFKEMNKTFQKKGLRLK